MNPWEKWSFGTGISEIQGLIHGAVEAVAHGDLTSSQEEALKANIAAAMKGPEPKVVSKKPIYFDELAVTDSVQSLYDAYMASVTKKVPMSPDLYSGKPKPESNVGLAHELIGIVPGLQQRVSGPCECAGSKENTVQHWIMHLNDQHIPRTPEQAYEADHSSESYFWTRTRIADWLDTLDVDLHVQEPGQEPWRLALKEAWELAELAAIVSGGTVSAHITDRVNNRRVRAQSVSAAAATVESLVRRNRPYTIWVTMYPQRWVIEPDGTTIHTENLGFDRDMEKVVAASKALVEAMKPLGDQIQMIGEAIKKAIDGNQQLLDALVEATKKEEAS